MHLSQYVQVLEREVGHRKVVEAINNYKNIA